ncbi:MAG: Polymorphic rane protein Filamentous hemagglutinin/Adhesin, partial [Burkholderia sp.]|nr:Polymorphic rane protein Filamentous hemagglutinin/Adhesin [Burkholderia sp.]
MNKQRRQARHTNDAYDAVPSSYVHLGGRKWVRCMALTMASLLVLQSALSVLPAYAQTTASSSAPAGQRPILDAARNGVPIVHIAPPSKAGVSRNQYDQFNVNQNGLILNNSPTNVQTQQGGWITGNLQLGPTPARIILNEVVGGNPSQLRGTIEVAGRRADIVVANPNGITCDGCGFLNADRASLTTGRPQFGSDGSINGFDVRQGQLTIAGSGLNATNLEQLDLIARGFVIEGEVWAKNLNVIAGANQVLYGTLQAAAQAGAGTAPRFAIDIKDLGGMYANQVYLMSTEQGVGVNSTGRTAALQGNLVLSANGDLSLQHSYAKQDIRIGSTGNVRLAGVTQSNGTTSVVASGTLDNSGGSLLAGGDASLQAGAIVNKAGSIASTIAAGGNVEIQGGSLNNDKSSIVAGGNVTLALAAGALSNNQGTIGAGGALAVNAGGLDNTAGQIVSSGDVRINSARFNNNNSGITASTAGKLDIDTHGQELNNDRGLLQAAGNVAI